MIENIVGYIFLIGVVMLILIGLFIAVAFLMIKLAIEKINNVF